MPLDGVRVVPLTVKAPPFVVFLLWRRGDVDPALGHVLATADELLPTTERDASGIDAAARDPSSAGTRTDAKRRPRGDQRCPVYESGADAEAMTSPTLRSGPRASRGRMCSRIHGPPTSCATRSASADAWREHRFGCGHVRLHRSQCQARRRLSRRRRPRRFASAFLRLNDRLIFNLDKEPRAMHGLPLLLHHCEPKPALCPKTQPPRPPP